MKELYEEEVDLRKLSRVGFAGFERNIRRYIDDIGKDYGFVPYFEGFENLVSFRDIGERPEYLDPEISKEFDYVKGRINQHLAKEFGVVPYLQDLQIRVANLPTYEWLYLDENGEMEKKPMGKVFGLYDPNTKEIIIDPVLFKNSEERKRLEKYFEIPTVERVLGEELLHYIQDSLGMIDYNLSRYGGEEARDRIEGAAAEEAEQVFGKTRIYGREKAKYRERGRDFFKGGTPEILGIKKIAKGYF